MALAALGLAVCSVLQAVGVGVLIAGLAGVDEVQVRGPARKSGGPVLRFDPSGPILVF